MRIGISGLNILLIVITLLYLQYYTVFELIFGKIPNIYIFLQENQIDPIYNIDADDKEIKCRLLNSPQRAKQMMEKYKIRSNTQYDR